MIDKPAAPQLRNQSTWEKATDKAKDKERAAATGTTASLAVLTALAIAVRS